MASIKLHDSSLTSNNTNYNVNYIINENVTSTSGSFTNLDATDVTLDSATITVGSITHLTSQYGSITNLYSTDATISNVLQATTGSFTNLYGNASNLTGISSTSITDGADTSFITETNKAYVEVDNVERGYFDTTLFYTPEASFTSGSMTNLHATTAIFPTIISQEASLTSASITNLHATTATFSTLYADASNLTGISSASITDGANTSVITETNKAYIKVDNVERGYFDTALFYTPEASFTSGSFTRLHATTGSFTTLYGDGGNLTGINTGSSSSITDGANTSMVTETNKAYVKVDNVERGYFDTTLFYTPEASFTSGSFTNIHAVNAILPTLISQEASFTSASITNLHATTGSFTTLYGDGSNLTGINTGSSSSITDGANTSMVTETNKAYVKVDNVERGYFDTTLFYTPEASFTSGSFTNLHTVNATITGTEVAYASITSGSITNLTVDNTTITDANITNATISDAYITNATITGMEVAYASITSGSITNLTVDNTTITDANIINLTTTNATITGTEVAYASITSGSITNLKIDNATITDANITNATISYSYITNATITGTEVAYASITSGSITNLTVDNATITDANITNATISDSYITNATITGTEVAYASITSGSITNLKVDNATITEANITDATITNAFLTNATITDANITNSTITNIYASHATITSGVNIGDANMTNATVTSGANIESLKSNAVEVTGEITLASLSDGTLSSYAGSIVDAKFMKTNYMHVQYDTTIVGNLSVSGSVTTINTNTTITDQFSVENSGTGPALIVNQTGSNDIVNFKDDGTSVFYIEDGGNVGIGLTDPTEKLDVNGTAKATSGVFTGATITNAVLTNATITGTEIAYASITNGSISNLTASHATISSSDLTNTSIDNATITGTEIAYASITSGSISNLTIDNATISSSNLTSTNIINATITNLYATTGSFSGMITDGTLTIEKGSISSVNTIIADDNLYISSDNANSELRYNVGANPVSVFVGSGNSDTNAFLAVGNKSSGAIATISTDVGYGFKFFYNTSGNLEMKRNNGSTTDEDILTILRSNSNIGIGTSAPTFQLDVDGSITAGTGSFTYLYGDGSNLVNITQINENDTSVVVSDSGTGEIQFTTDNTLTATMKSNKFGIGTTEPTHQLDVSGSITAGTGSFTYLYGDGSNLVNMTQISENDTSVAVSDSGTGEIQFTTDNTLTATMKSNKFGIGTTEPTHQLDVSGSITAGTGSFTFLYGDGSNLVNMTQISENDTSVGVSDSGTGEIQFTTDNALMATMKSGNVGIGVSDPDQKLELTGIMHMSEEQTSAPSAPADGDGGLVYVKNDGNLYYTSNEVSDYNITGGDTTSLFFDQVVNNNNKLYNTTTNYGDYDATSSNIYKNVKDISATLSAGYQEISINWNSNFVNGSDGVQILELYYNETALPTDSYDLTSANNGTLLTSLYRSSNIENYQSVSQKVIIDVPNNASYKLYALRSSSASYNWGTTHHDITSESFDMYIDNVNYNISGSTTGKLAINKSTADSELDVHGTISALKFNVSTLNLTYASVSGGSFTNITVENATITEANITDGTIVDLFSTNATITEAYITDGTIVDLFSTNATITEAYITDGTIVDLFSTNATISTGIQIAYASITSGSITNVKIDNATITDADITNGTVSNLFTTNATISTGVQIAYASITNGSITNVKIDDATITDADITNGTVSNLFTTNATISTGIQIAYASITSGSITNVKINNATITDANITNGTITNLFTTTAVITEANITDGTIVDLFSTNATITGAYITDGTIVDLFSTNATITDADITNGTVSNLFTTNATISTGIQMAYASITSGSITNVKIDNATITDADITNGTVSNLFTTNATISTGIQIAYASITNGSITNVKIDDATITDANITNGTITNLFTTTAVITEANITDGTIVDLFSTNATITGAYMTDGTVVDLFSTNATITDADITNGTVSNLFTTNATISTGVQIAYASITNGSITNLHASTATFTTLYADASNLSGISSASITDGANTSVITETNKAYVKVDNVERGYFDTELFYTSVGSFTNASITYLHATTGSFTTLYGDGSNLTGISGGGGGSGASITDGANTSVITETNKAYVKVDNVERGYFDTALFYTPEASFTSGSFTNLNAVHGSITTLDIDNALVIGGTHSSNITNNGNLYLSSEDGGFSSVYTGVDADTYTITGIDNRTYDSIISVYLSYTIASDMGDYVGLLYPSDNSYRFGIQMRSFASGDKYFMPFVDTVNPYNDVGFGSDSDPGPANAYLGTFSASMPNNQTKGNSYETIIQYDFSIDSQVNIKVYFKDDSNVYDWTVTLADFPNMITSGSNRITLGSGTHLVLGKQTPAGGNYFKGTISDVRIFEREIGDFERNHIFYGNYGTVSDKIIVAKDSYFSETMGVGKHDPRNKLSISHNRDNNGAGIHIDNFGNNNGYGMILNDDYSSGSSATFVDFRTDNVSIGNIAHNGSGAVSYNNFTGQHRCFINDHSLTSLQNYEGLIVCANKNNYTLMSGSLSSGLNAKVINEALPDISICSKDNDKTVFGIISNIEDENERKDSFGVYHNVLEKEAGDTRPYINSLGEGCIWICNKNGSIESGDYITSSSVAGYGMKQTDDLLHNYTVAKITMDCDFVQSQIAKKIILKDIHGDNILDANGFVQFVSDTETENKYNLRYLMSDGTQITESEYDTKLANSETVYIGAFVGCTYHCG